MHKMNHRWMIKIDLHVLCLLQVVDISVAPLATLPTREEVMDFTVSYYSEYTCGLYKKPTTGAKVR